MIRTVITPTNTRVSIVIPDEYVGKKVEITYLALDELEQTEPSKEKNMSSFWNVISNKTAEILHNEVKQNRDQWD